MKELLVPVGSMESLKVAVRSGADAVYLGGKKFGARAYATNFDNLEMIEAIKFCHLYGVKIYVTVNTLIYESEFEEAINYLEFLYTNCVDAVIVQDIGLIKEARRRYPNLEIHASTQVHNTNQDGINYLNNLGVKRVVFARELSIDEIDNIKTPMEKEAFIHGALCISFSGQCLFSSMILDRSGNRGSCAQLCRLPYKLMVNGSIIDTDGEYLLSTKELNTSFNFKRIMDSSILSLKIEGRMKSPEYVGCVTRLYRDLIDKYNAGLEVLPDPELIDDLRVIFNREYTNGLLFNSNNDKLMNIKTSNHVGVHLGKTIRFDKKYVYIKLDRDINQGDGIRFNDTNEGMIVNFLYDEKLNLINGAKKGSVVALDNKFAIKENTLVNKTLDIFVIDKYRKIADKEIGITIKFVAHVGSPMKLVVNDCEHEVSQEYGMVDVAQKQAMDEEKIYKQINRLSETPFVINNIEYDIDANIFINIKHLNEIRRLAIAKLIDIRENVKKDIVINNQDYLYIDYPYNKECCITVLVRSEEQIKCCLDNNVNQIYVDNFKLYSKYKKYDNVLYRTKRVYDNTNEYALLTELGALNRIKSGVGDYFLNSTNHYTIDEFMNYLDRVTLSVELSDDEISNIMDYYNHKLNVELVVYSNIELMLLKYCPLKTLVNKDENCHVCTSGNKYYLVDRFDKQYPILTDTENHITHILNYKVTNKIDKCSYYRRLGINHFRIELLYENYDETMKIISELRQFIK